MISYKVLREGCEPREGKGDAGLDLRCSESIFIHPQETIKMPVGITFEIPERSFVQISARSSIALQGLYVHIGTVDASFNGKEVCIIATNLSDDPITFLKGDRIAQAVGLNHLQMAPVTKAIDSRDSKDGFGSSGRA